jgi:hypothetical protein
MEAAIARVEAMDDLPRALGELGLGTGRPTIALVGGAGSVDEATLERLRAIFASLVPTVERLGATVVDGGTDAGVMRLLGSERAASSASFPLVGVVVASLADEATEPNHTHFVLVPGERWGDETPWLARVAGVLAGDGPSLTLLVNGGEIALRDAAASVAERRPVLVVVGSGRTADTIARDVRRRTGDADTQELVTSGLMRTVEFRGGSGATVAAAVEELLESTR